MIANTVFLKKLYFHKKPHFKIQIPSDYFYKIDLIFLVPFPHFNWLCLEPRNSLGQKSVWGVPSKCHHLHKMTLITSFVNIKRNLGVLLLLITTHFLTNRNEVCLLDYPIKFHSLPGMLHSSLGFLFKHIRTEFIGI